MANGDVSWNIFTRVFEQILDEHGYSIWQLSGTVHPQQLGRVHRAARERKFSILSREDLEAVVEKCQLTLDEQLEIRAALLATAIEETLMNRIRPDDALLAAEQMYPVLLAMLRKYRDGPGGISAIKGGPLETVQDTIEPLSVADAVLQALPGHLQESVALMRLADTPIRDEPPAQ